MSLIAFIPATAWLDEKIERDRLSILRLNSPSMYLSEIKGKVSQDKWLLETKQLDQTLWLSETRRLLGDAYWLPALEEVDPAAFSEERIRREAERKKLAAEQEEQRKAKALEEENQRKAEVARLAKLRQKDPKAYLAAIEGAPNYMDELKKLSPGEYKKMVAKQKDEQRQLAMAGSELELIKWSWQREYDYAIVEGVVRNISGQPLKNVEAVVSFQTKSGEFITADTALVDYNPILRGQASPFKVIARWNPAMARANIEFKYLFGGTLNVYQNK
ncbi:MAG: hypothetical protein ABI705_08110 [Aestuariivirga sp.]